MQTGLVLSLHTRGRARVHTCTSPVGRLVDSTVESHGCHVVPKQLE